MGARVTLCKALAEDATSASITARMARPPFLFTSPQVGSSGAAWTGAVSIEMSLDTPPLPNNGGGVSNGGVSDANASWQVIVATLAPGDSVEWQYPIYRVRVNGADIVTGTPDVFMLEQAFNPDTASDGR